MLNESKKFFSRLWGGTESFWAEWKEVLSFTFRIFKWQQAKNRLEQQFATRGMKTCWEALAWTFVRGKEGVGREKQGRDGRGMATETHVETDGSGLGMTTNQNLIRGAYMTRNDAPRAGPWIQRSSRVFSLWAHESWAVRNLNPKSWQHQGSHEMQTLPTSRC